MDSNCQTVGGREVSHLNSPSAQHSLAHRLILSEVVHLSLSFDGHAQAVDASIKANVGGSRK